MTSARRRRAHTAGLHLDEEAAIVGHADGERRVAVARGWGRGSGGFQSRGGKASVTQDDEAVDVC